MGIGGSSVDLGYKSLSTLTREEVLEEREKEATRIRSCGPCNRGTHEACVGLSCRCVVTARCRRNEKLTVEREGPVR